MIEFYWCRYILCCCCCWFFFCIFVYVFHVSVYSGMVRKTWSTTHSCTKMFSFMNFIHNQPDRFPLLVYGKGEWMCTKMLYEMNIHSGYSRKIRTCVVKLTADKKYHSLLLFFSCWLLLLYLFVHIGVRSVVSNLGNSPSRSVLCKQVRITLKSVIKYEFLQ